MKKSRFQARKGFDYLFDEQACRTCNGNCCNGKTGNVYLTLHFQ